MFVFALIAAPHAADISLKGMACWTGERKMMAASNENWDMGFDIKGTYMDEISNEENSYFEYAGHIHMINRVMKGQTYNCMRYFADGSQALEIGEIKNDSGTKSTFQTAQGVTKVFWVNSLAVHAFQWVSPLTISLEPVARYKASRD